MAYDKFKNVFVSDNGDLINKSDYHVVREKYSYTFRQIENRQQLRATIRIGKYGWPGGYPLYLMFGDGEPCCFECANKEYKRIARDMKDGYDKSFQIIGCDINYEDNDMYCANCNTKIESAYGED
jgi:hypothetical protein